ncbi:MAG: hypothetical protein ABSG44_02015 [Thermodesulfobacteriota bacterium]|jgi:hypothetical protein
MQVLLSFKQQKILRAIKIVFPKVKNTWQYFESPGYVGVFGAMTLFYLSVTQGHIYVGLSIIILGIFFGFLASYNSGRHKSTDLVDEYEERFFIRMKAERKHAAQYLLGEIKNNACLKWVLDYLEAPIAEKVVKEQIDTMQVYSYFRHWIELYWQASQKDIQIYRKNDPGAWPTLGKLYNIMITLEKKELGERYVGWNEERVEEALKDEASLVL